MVEIKVNIALTDETTEVLENLIQAVHGIGGKSAPLKKKSTKKKEVEETPPGGEPTPFGVSNTVSNTVSNGAPATLPTAPTVVPTVPTVVPTVPTVVPTVPTVPIAPSPQVPTQGVMYTAQQLSIAGAELVDAGKMPELQALLQQFGVPAITSLDPAYYSAFAEGLRSLGGRI